MTTSLISNSSRLGKKKKPKMQQHKRNAPSEGAVPTAKKSRQLAAEAPPPTTLDEALQIIEMFKAEQAELVDHIVKTDAKSLST